MSKLRTKELAVGVLSITGGMIAGNAIKKKLVAPLVSKFMPTLGSNDLVLSLVVAALGAAGYLFKDKFVPKSYHGIVENVCEGIAAGQLTDVAKAALPAGLQGAIGLGDASVAPATYHTYNTKAMRAPMPSLPATKVVGPTIQDAEFTIV